MTTDGIRQRQMPATVPVIEKLKAQRTQAAPEPAGATDTTEPEAVKATESTQHPGGEIKHGVFAQALRMCLFAAYFNGSIIASVYTQLIGCIGH
jgi:lysocardiolipin and lysophospholipid acyltransferase